MHRSRVIFVYQRSIYSPIFQHTFLLFIFQSAYIRVYKWQETTTIYTCVTQMLQCHVIIVYEFGFKKEYFALETCSDFTAVTFEG